MGQPQVQKTADDSPSSVLAKLVAFQMYAFCFVHTRVISLNLVVFYSFRSGFFIIIGVSSVSTLVDIIKDRQPMSFGSQHIALLLVAGWPGVVFGMFILHFPAPSMRLT